MSESGKCGSDTEQNGLIYIYWAACPECGYTTAVHGRARCPYCDQMLAPYDIAGGIVDDQSRSEDSRGETDV